MKNPLIYLIIDWSEGNGDCLLDKPSENLLEDIWRSDSRYSTGQELRQPGELFDKDLQCQLVFGPSSRICPYMPVCKRLWCTIHANGGGCRTQHMPWADGTPCAQSKWCQQGECVPIQKMESRPVDGQWGPWGPHSECSRSCGGGIQKSNRECNHPKYGSFPLISIYSIEVFVSLSKVTKNSLIDKIGLNLAANTVPDIVFVTVPAVLISVRPLPTTSVKNSAEHSMVRHST